MEEGEVVVGFAVAAGGDAALCFQPGVCALDGPAVAGLWVGCFQAALSAPPHLPGGGAGGDRLPCSAGLADAGLDLALAQRLLELAAGIATVCPQLLRADTAGCEGLYKGEEMALLVLVAGREPYLERRAVRVDGQVVAAAGETAERARDLLAPFFASTKEASTITRDQSSRSALASSSCKTVIAAANNPRADHSSSLRRHVSPLGRPSSRKGTCNQGVSV